MGLNLAQRVDEVRTDRQRPRSEGELATGRKAALTDIHLARLLIHERLRRDDDVCVIRFATDLTRAASAPGPAER